MFLKFLLLLRRLNWNPSNPKISPETGRKLWPKESKTTRGEERLGRDAVLTSEQSHGGGTGQTARSFSADSEATPTTRALRERGGAREATPARPRPCLFTYFAAGANPGPAPAPAAAPPAFVSLSSR